MTLTLFSFGYWGWGNATRELVARVDEIEAARGFAPPFFADVRLRRSVRAPGFSGRAFERLLGPDRHVWMPALGNDAIAHGGAMRLHDPAAAGELLDRARRLATENRRLLFFCACERPEECHRSLVAEAVRDEARRRKTKVSVVEWPGDEPPAAAFTPPRRR